MRKLIPTILLLCIFTNGCQNVKRTKDAIDKALTPYRLIQSYALTATKNKTYVNATIYYSQFRRDSKPKAASKIEFNGVEMQQGTVKEEEDYSSPCDKLRPETAKQLTNPEFVASTAVKKTPEPTPEEFKFFIVLDGYQTENTVTITNPDNQIETYKIKFEPLELENPESIKISRTKENTIQLKGKGSGKKDDLYFFITQDGEIFDNESVEFNSADNTIKIPAKISKKLNKGLADISFSSDIQAELNTPGILNGNSFSVSYDVKACAEIVD